MEHARLRKSTVKSATLTKIVRSRNGWAILIVALLIGSALLTAAVRAYNRSTLSGANFTKPSTAPLVRQANVPRVGKVQSGLSLQPQADKLRRALGQRFVAPGRERATMAGRLTVGDVQYQAVIIRTQNDDGENVEIALNGGPASFTWSAPDGAKSGATQAVGIERALIERLALDSPDQFVLAQVRGASYYTVARNVRPAEAGDSEDYAGPVWDLVRIGESESTGQNRPQSTWRVYYINSVTGLIDKIFSREQGDPILAEFSDWVKQGNELAPTRITWSRNDQVVMDLVLSSIAQGPRQ